MEMRWTTHQRFQSCMISVRHISASGSPRRPWPSFASLWASVSRLYLIVVPDPPKESRDKSELKPGVPPPGWVKEQQQNIKKQLKEAGSKAKRGEMPDQTEVWQKETTGQWWMIVTVNLDAEGKERSSVPIPLREGEPPEQLMARVKAATQRAYVKHAGQAAEKLTEQAPKWARDLRNGLWRELATPAQAGARQRGFSRSADARCRPPRRGDAAGSGRPAARARGGPWE